MCNWNWPGFFTDFLKQSQVNNLRYVMLISVLLLCSTHTCQNNLDDDGYVVAIVAVVVTNVVTIVELASWILIDWKKYN